LTVNRLILGDNLEILKTLEAESVDLIYLDPPFFSNRTYEVIRAQ
jgi:site-specific DNA-methyltransferase (adenine-specific)